MDDYSVTLNRKQVKNITLRIKRTGEVEISAPIKTPLEFIQRFLHHKRDWIDKHRYRLQQRIPDPEQQLMPGEYLHFQGNPFRLQLHEIQTNPRVEMSENQIHLFIKSKSTQAQKERLLTRWYLAQMKKLLPPLFEKWQAIMGVTVNQISIRRMKSRWGSCHPIKKNITLNLALIEKPLICLEYVIVHELVHLFEASHNQNFYALMSHYLPDWKTIKKQLS